MSVAQGSTGVKQVFEANDGINGPEYKFASERLAEQRAKTTEKVMKSVRKAAALNPEHGEMTEPPSTKAVKKKRESHRAIARRVYNDFAVPLAFFGDKFWGSIRCSVGMMRPIKFIAPFN